MADKVDQLWETYDADRSGALDKQEAREFITDLLNQISSGDTFNEDFFEVVFNRFDVDRSGTVEKEEMLRLIRILLYGDASEASEQSHDGQDDLSHSRSNHDSKTQEMEKLIS